MVTDEDIQRAFDWLRDNAEKAAEARAQRVGLEEGRKRIKAMLMKKHLDKPVSAQEREAYADPEYAEYLEGMQEAIARDEHFRWLRDAAIAKIDAWRTMAANQRGAGRVA